MANAHASPSHGEHEGYAHVSSLPMMAGVLAVLLALTIITVAVAYVDMGALNLPIALLIATVKATLVVLFFMHLWWDDLFNTVVFVAGLLFLIQFLTFTIMDVSRYQPDIKARQDVLEQRQKQAP